MDLPVAAVEFRPGYAVLVFPHDDGVFSVLFLRGADDRELAALRHVAAFDAATAAVPLLTAWTAAARAVPVTGVLAGGRLHNTWAGQLDAGGGVALPGLVFVGDTVCTTNPAAGRGVALSLLQARRLLATVDDLLADPVPATRAFDAWCTERIRPWFDDHVACDAGLAARWAGADVDLDAPLPADLIGAAAEVDPSMMRVVGPYQAMLVLPTAPAEVEPRARKVYASGWRPPVPAGPTRDELAAVVTRAAGKAGAGDG